MWRSAISEAREEGCEVGALICYGAETDPRTDIYWGVGLDGVESCADCCEPCDDVLVE